jgi:DoxX
MSDRWRRNRHASQQPETKKPHRSVRAAKTERRTPRRRMRFSNAPLRLSAGAYILNAGITHLQDREGAFDLQKTAGATYPELGNLEPDQFLLLLAGGEAALGSVLLIPQVSPRLAGLGLAAFSGSLLGMYWHDERFRRSPTSFRPSQEGEALLKDIWLLGMALALMLQRTPSRRR